MTGNARKAMGWLWVVLFYALILLAGMALVGGGTVLATFALGVLQSDASWHLIAGITLMAAGVAVFVAGAVLLFRITRISVPGRSYIGEAKDRAAGHAGYTDGGIGTHGSYGHHHSGGGGHDGGGGTN